ncbi:hypothetical protein [Maridesulfovibrio bastinii]|uniref:hypothetical protein n=1 Tax=Maridesulfovibrio bastinii TaxID=47157 RepID=UPI000487A73E|nr:hypothetical protein [Maridesulfovibrio bastinii]
MIKGIVTFYSDCFRSSPLPHIVLVFCLVCAFCMLLYSIELYLAERHITLTFTGAVLLGLLCGACFSVADIIARYREYRRIRKILRQRGFHHRVFNTVAASRCQRDAAMLAAKQTGHKLKASEFYYKLGYRWYHLLPDAVLQRPWIIFRFEFLAKAFLPGKKPDELW